MEFRDSRGEVREKFSEGIARVVYGGLMLFGGEECDLRILVYFTRHAGVLSNCRADNAARRGNLRNWRNGLRDTLRLSERGDVTRRRNKTAV